MIAKRWSTIEDHGEMMINTLAYTVLSGRLVMTMQAHGWLKPPATLWMQHGSLKL
jgi:hypothetical protein